MRELPVGFIAYHHAGRQLEGDLGEFEPGWYQLWPLADIEEFNREYLVEEQAPGYLGIGSDGGGEMIAIAPTGEIVILPFIGMEAKEARPVATSWNEFESRIRSSGA
jgi:hypothetical protein